MKMFIFVIVLFSGCATVSHTSFVPTPVSFKMDKGLDREASEAIRTVLSELKQEGGSDDVYSKIGTRRVLFVYDEKLTFEQFGSTQCDKGFCLIKINARFRPSYLISMKFFFNDPDLFSNQALKNTIRHEIGHAFGLDHIPQENQIMSERVPNFTYISKQAIRSWLKQIHKQII